MNLGILRLFSFLFICLFLTNLNAAIKDLDFDLIKRGDNSLNNTMLIVGGIQGDEPGGFMAASLITTHYTIEKGSVWVIPNLNFYSIIKRNRGPFGDMNRKFAKISKNDPDYSKIERIKDYILKDNVKLVLNLHDGSGFFRKKTVNGIYAPYRWGQSSIIDQERIDVQKYGNLEEISTLVCKHVNENLIRQRDKYHVKNTHTRMGDKEMEKSLTYFAINNGKAAFGNEASKNLPLHERAYYHLLAIEKYMDIMGIKFHRNFELNPKSLKNVIDNDIYISFYNDKIRLPLGEIRNKIGYFPVKKDGKINFKPSNPLMLIIKNKESYSIHYGNRRLARLFPDYFDIANELDNVKLNIDGVEKEVPIGSIVNVQNDFLVKKSKNIRVNVIGYVNNSFENESGLKISKKDIIKRFSIDKKGKLYRVEFYKDNNFVGMIVVNFDHKSPISDKNLSATSSDKLSSTSL
ncbi:deacylase [Malaciobacter molluscorum]|uniref:M99 family carboxypeptidase catalytic domain-containing protein n=1 Tax=Malaciobacter molluscorum TaxID=1032072 RepID=UPI00100B06E4|nr:M99 family carboxypeptidase catalytic domain-containing protein [Malaciobacter molluscorum]RXJ92552.1 deacylase [Malaciobacter molluscorum]